MAVTAAILGPGGRSRRRMTRYFECTETGAYAGGSGDVLDLTTATNPNYHSGVAGLFPPTSFAQEFSVAATSDQPYVAGGVKYDVIVSKNPAATSWANAILVQLINGATGAPLAAGALTGSFTFELEVSGPFGTF